MGAAVAEERWRSEVEECLLCIAEQDEMVQALRAQLAAGGAQINGVASGGAGGGAGGACAGGDGGWAEVALGAGTKSMGR